MTDSTLPIHDPWFIIGILWWFFSAITSGMPEPDDNSGVTYIWIYRSFHVISANGTAYFIHRKKWHDISGE